MKRIIRFFKMILSLFIESAEESVPLERRLAYDRQERAEGLKKMMDKATDVGAAAEMMVQALAESRIIAQNVREEAVRHLQAADAAAKRGDTATEETEHAQAAALAEDLAEAEAEVRELEQTVDDALKDKGSAKNLILMQAAELEHQSRKDASLVAKVRMTEMREQANQMREEILQLIPEDRDDIRRRALSQAQKREARVKTRSEIVDALWQQKKRGMIDRRTQVSTRGAELLQQLESQVGYQPTKAMPAPAEVSSEATLKKLTEGMK